jgi:hypothetical protein
MTVLPYSPESLQWQQRQRQQEKQLERNRSKLCILYHAATCPYEGDTNTHHDTTTGTTINAQHRQYCPLERRCCAAKRLFVHINGCVNAIHCAVPGCKHSRAVWKHYRKCRHNTPEQHAACPLCSVVPAPFNPARLCAQFRVPPRTATHYGGDSIAATRGSDHDQQDQIDQEQQQEQQLSIGRPPRRIQSLHSQKSTPLTTTTATTTAPTTLAAKQAAAKLMGSILDDSTIGSVAAETLYLFPEQQSQSRELEKENSINRSFNRPIPIDSTTRTVPACVMDAFGTLMGDNSSTSLFAEPEHLSTFHSTTRSSMSQHSYASGGGRKTNRYYQLEDSLSSSPASNKWGGFLSMRRTRSKNGEAQPTMYAVNSSLIMPTDEEDSMAAEMNWKERQVSTTKPSDGRRESSMRRNQRR